MIDYTSVRLFEALPNITKLSETNNHLKLTNTVIICSAVAILTIGAIYIYNQKIKYKKYEIGTHQGKN